MEKQVKISVWIDQTLHDKLLAMSIKRVDGKRPSISDLVRFALQKLTRTKAPHGSFVGLER